MLPEFDTFGNLPEGIHDATISDIERRFAGNRRRSVIFGRLEHWLKVMQAAGCEIVFVDGSFVTAKVAPNDFDACYNPKGVDVTLLDPDLLDRTDAGIRRAKEKYGGDIRIDYEFPPGSISPYVRFFMRDSRTGRTKGIVRIDLRRETT